MEETILYYKTVETEAGPMTMVCVNDAIVRLDYGTMDDLMDTYHKWADRYFTNPVFFSGNNGWKFPEKELEAYFRGERRDFTIPIALHGTSFQQTVWQQLQSIPYGETVTYKDIAQDIGRPEAVRAVGGAINKNPISIVVPCHRVIGSNGKMTGYNGGLDKKEHLLNLEHSNWYMTQEIDS